MKAVSYSSFGSPSSVLNVLDIEKPKPKANEVLVKLYFSGVNPSDAKARAGGRPGVSNPPFDRIIPHSDGSGIIVEVGKNISSKDVTREYGFGMVLGTGLSEPPQNIFAYQLIKQ